MSDNEPAFPLNELNQTTGEVCAQHFGLTLRDFFATNAPSDSVQELNYRCLSRNAQERLAGLKHPTEPHPYRDHDPARIDYQIAEFEFKCAVEAAIRFKLADAMLKARAR